MKKTIIHSQHAPAPSGTYSQAVQVGNMVFLAGQIPTVPSTGELCSSDIQAQIKQVFENLQAVAKAAGGTLNNIVKLSVYLLDLKQFAHVNEIMAQYFIEPYPARVTLGVAALPKGAGVEIEAIMVLDN